MNTKCRNIPRKRVSTDKKKKKKNESPCTFRSWILNNVLIARGFTPRCILVQWIGSVALCCLYAVDFLRFCPVRLYVRPCAIYIYTRTHAHIEKDDCIIRICIYLYTCMCLYIMCNNLYVPIFFFYHFLLASRYFFSQFLFFFFFLSTFSTHVEKDSHAVHWQTNTEIIVIALHTSRTFSHTHTHTHNHPLGI